MSGIYLANLMVTDDYDNIDFDSVEITVTEPTPVPSISFGGFALLAGLMIGSTLWLIRRQRIASA